MFSVLGCESDDELLDCDLGGGLSGFYLVVGSGEFCEHSSGAGEAESLCLFEEILLVIFDVKSAAYLIAGESFFEQGRGGKQFSEMVGEGADSGVGGGVVGVEHSSEAFDSASGVAGGHRVNDLKGVEYAVSPGEGLDVFGGYAFFGADVEGEFVNFAA